MFGRGQGRPGRGPDRGFIDPLAINRYQGAPWPAPLGGSDQPCADTAFMRPAIVAINFERSFAGNRCLPVR